MKHFCGQRRECGEHLVAEREEYDIHIIRGDMTKPFPFADASFDLIFNPASQIESRKLCVDDIILAEKQERPWQRPLTWQRLQRLQEM